MCCWGRKREYFAGKIANVKDTKFDVHFDDGGKKRNAGLGDIYLPGVLDNSDDEWIPSIAF
jgi:hypothetical protein